MAEAEKAQRGAMEADERVGMIEEYLNRELPDDWDEMDLFARRNFLTGTEFGVPEHAGKHIRTEVSNAEIWCECFGKKPAGAQTVRQLWYCCDDVTDTRLGTHQYDPASAYLWQAASLPENYVSVTHTTQLFPLYSKRFL